MGGSDMADQWFYTRDANRLGPFSAPQFWDLAAAGQIRRTDMVWKAGIERRVLAGNVTNLFSAAEVDAVPSAAVDTHPGPVPAESPAPFVTPISAIIPDSPFRSESPTSPTAGTGTLNAPSSQPVRRGRAVALQGAVIVSQDGQIVRYIKKCTACGHNDPCKSRMPIRRGTTRLGFYCPKCKKLRQVEIRGII
jgi:hypothetical protein